MGAERTLVQSRPLTPRSIPVCLELVSINRSTILWSCGSQLTRELFGKRVVTVHPKFSIYDASTILL